MNPLGVIVADDGVRPRCENGRVPGEAMERIANRPIIEHVLDALELAGVEDIVVVSSSRLGAGIRDCLRGRQEQTGRAVRLVERQAPLEVTDALRAVAPIVGDAPCVVHLASGLLEEPLRPLLDRLSDTAPDILLLAHQAASPREHLSVATHEMLRLAAFRADHALGMAGVWMFGPGALPLAAATPWSLCGDVDLTLLGKRISAAGGDVKVTLADTWLQYRGDPLDLLDLNRLVLDRLGPAPCRFANGGNRIEGRVWIDAAALVRSSVIVGPTVIGPGARITDAYIGPYTSIGQQARVEGAEIERSIIAAGASVTHVGGRLVSSVLGRDARVFRDFSLPRALRLRVGEGTEVALC